jgi:BirA family biotin operon repressor/biotin-[acetyl-CoA-carboxylase] ligase
MEERDSKLIEELRRTVGEFVSGSGLAGLLGVTRAAVAKRVARLRRNGFEIEAVHNRGYRLVVEPSQPDSLRPEVLMPLLTTQWLGRTYFYHRRLSSTSDEARRLARDGAPHGTLVLAEEQEAGRGRLGRAWFSGPDEDLTFSAVLRPELDPVAAPPLTLAAAVGVAEGVRGFVGNPPKVKWPNDVLYRGRKLCGILTEMSAEVGRIDHVVLGIGLNVNTIGFPDELIDCATSLRAERGRPVRRSQVLVSVLGAVERWFEVLVREGAGPVIEAWTALADFLGRTVVVQLGERQTTGVALDLDPSGALRLRREDGTVEIVNAGEVTLSR